MVTYLKSQLTYAALRRNRIAGDWSRLAAG
jgi:hypothetical protein